MTYFAEYSPLDFQRWGPLGSHWGPSTVACPTEGPPPEQTIKLSQN